MKCFWNSLLLLFSLVYIVSSLLPISTADNWWVRVWDFPRAQLAVLGLICLVLASFISLSFWIKTILVILLCIALALDVYRIYPYTFIHGVEAKENTLTSGTQKISILEANVLQSNGDHEVLKKFIREKSPDIFFLTEVNDDWARSLREFDSTYPHHLLHPQDNTYGLAFYSRLPWHHAKVNFLIEAEIPSVEAEIILPSGDSVQVYGLHPRPPRPQNKFTTERDAELIKVARSAKATERAVLLVGDLNDVAWSHTTRLFRRVSRMLDIRIGRGFFPTFPVGYGVFRFPIDHVFISDHFRVADVQVLSDIGSDHYPLWVTLSYEPGLTEFQEAPKADQENRKEAQEILEKVK